VPPIAAPGYPTSPAAPSWTPPNPPPPFPPSGPSPSSRRRGNGWRALVALTVVVGLLVAGFFVGRLTDDEASTGGPAVDQAQLEALGLPTAAPVEANAEEPIAAVAEAIAPAVVQIETDIGLGSGVVYDPDGLIITNNHVVEGDDAVEVRMADGSVVDGEVLGTDPLTDVAVVKVPADSVLGVAVLGVGQEVRVGQLAVAVGSPFGLDQTVTSGIVSAVGRPFGEEILVGMIQTDAPINSGNSGGALVDREGRVIGINTAIFSNTGDNSGLGFAIPIDLVFERAERLAAGEQIEGALLGVGGPEQGDDSDDDKIGAYIGSVEPGGGADEAGLEVGDEVIEFNGESVRTFSELATKIIERLPGEEVELTVERDGETLQIEAVLGSR
jgi:S1-C subfamily serine protease